MVKLKPTSFHINAYDALMVMSLAITAAGSTDAASIAAKFREVANPPGHVVYPGEWGKAFRLLAKGIDINYEGAAGPIDLDARGNASGVYEVRRFKPDGSTEVIGRFP